MFRASCSVALRGLSILKVQLDPDLHDAPEQNLLWHQPRCTRETVARILHCDGIRIEGVVQIEHAVDSCATDREGASDAQVELIHLNVTEYVPGRSSTI